MPVQQDLDELWPEQAHAAWPRRCLINNIAVHPQQPWLAAACTDADAEIGAALLFNAETPRLRSSTHLDGHVGWSEDRDLLRWHPDGQRLATNAQTNGITLLRRGQVVGRVIPDETRDHGVGYVWVGDHIFSDTGALFEINDGDELFPPFGAIQFSEIQWNAAIGAVVGREQDGIAAFDPVRKQLIYRVPGVVEVSGNAWSADGRWFAALDRARPPANDRIRIYRGDDGGLQGTVVPSLHRIQRLFWGRDGALAVECYAETNGKRTAEHVDVIRNAGVAQIIDLGPRRIEASYSVPEAGGVAWSPDGDRLALLLDHQEVQIRDATTGNVLETFSAKAPPAPKGLPRVEQPGDLIWLSAQRIVRLAPYFVSFWSADGHKLGELVVDE